jgi:hypothetical protein
MYSPQGTTAYEGMKLADIPGKDYHLTIVHGGAVPGINSILYTTTKWEIGGAERRKELLDNYMHFYTVKDRR